MKRALAALVLLGLSACETPLTPISTSPTNNSQANISFLFEHDGCKVYRFLDGPWYHYFVKCGDGKDQTIAQEPCGKNCIRDENIDTVPVRGLRR